MAPHAGPLLILTVEGEALVELAIKVVDIHWDRPACFHNILQSTQAHLYFICLQIICI